MSNMKKKKVENCSVKELEEYYIRQTGFIPDHIDIYWYDVRFMKYNSKTGKYEVEFSLRKDEEIKVEETENICNTCRLNNQCPLEHKPNLQCPYDDYEKR